MPPTGHKVSPERLEEFRRIYKEAYGEEISAEEVTAMTHQLLALYRLLSRPLPASASSILLRHHLGLKALPKKSDIMQNTLTIFALQVAQNLFCQFGKCTPQSSNIIDDSQLVLPGNTRNGR
jgi:hypothetical protein